MEAWGQNANYIPNRYNQAGVALLSCDLGEIIWDDPKPYVIYGVLVIDSCKLTLPPDTRVYVHGGLAKVEGDNEEDIIYNDGIIFVLEKGKLNIKGTYDQPVIIQGDRLEEFFADDEGQWAGIRLGAGSKGNIIENATIKNSIVGVRVDSAAELNIKNTQIYNTAGSGLIGLHSRVIADNCLFYNNNGNCVQFEYGGNYFLRHCTLASYGVDAAALKMTNVLCLDQFCQEFRYNALNLRCFNSIIFGSRKDEIDPFDVVGDQLPNYFEYDFRNSIIKMDEVLEEEQFMNFLDNCDPCINAPSDAVIFANSDDDDYHLDTLSIAEEMAVPINSLEIDLDNVQRDPNTPDIGCYEYVY